MEAELIGLYDVFTVPDRRNEALPIGLREDAADCERLGWEDRLLRVGASNPSARAVYRALGFADAYSYHDRTPAA